MRGTLKSKSALSQFLVLIGIALVSLFLIGALGTVILAKLAGMEFSQLADMSKWDYSDPKILFVLRGMQVIQFISLFVIPVFLCAWFFSTDTRSYLGIKAPSSSVYFIVGVLVMLVATPFINLLGEWNKQVQFPSGIEHWMKSSEEDAAKSVNALLSRHTLTDLISNLIVIAGLAAVGEELLFRGMIQRLLTKMFRSPWAGIIIAAFLFSAIHLQFYGFLPRFVLGILLGAAFWYSGSLWVPILGHFVYDGSLIVLAYYKPEMLADNNTVKAGDLALAAAISTVLVVAGVTWMIRNTKTRYSEVYAEDAKPVKDHPFDFE